MTFISLASKTQNLQPRINMELGFLHNDSAPHTYSLSASISVICDSIFKTGLLPKNALLSSIDPLEFQILQFRNVLPSAAANFDWDFRKKEKLIIQDASAGLYKENDIEGIFFKHGGLSGIAALIIYFRTKALDRSFSKISREFHHWLVNSIVKMLEADTVQRLLLCVSEFGMFHEL